MVSLPLGGTEILLIPSLLLLISAHTPGQFASFASFNLHVSTMCQGHNIPALKTRRGSLLFSIPPCICCAVGKSGAISYDLIQHDSLDSGSLWNEIHKPKKHYNKTKQTCIPFLSFDFLMESFVAPAKTDWCDWCEGRFAQVGNATDLQGLEDDGLLDNILMRSVLSVLSALDLNGWTYLSWFMMHHTAKLIGTETWKSAASALH